MHPKDNFHDFVTHKEINRDFRALFSDRLTYDLIDYPALPL